MPSPLESRKHSKFSASGADRWLACPGSVSLSEGIPSTDSVYSIEGTRAHDFLEKALSHQQFKIADYSSEMVTHGLNAANFIRDQRRGSSALLVETRIAVPIIHPDAFGTFDSGIIEHFGTLQLFDYKFGRGHAVSPVENYQMLFYGIGLAAKYDWNFARVRLWIIQPRIRSYDGPVYWEIGIRELKSYVKVFQDGVKRTFTHPTEYKEGPWCFFCPGKEKCPLKTKVKRERAKTAFSAFIKKGK